MSVLQLAKDAIFCRFCSSSANQRAVGPETMLGTGQWLYRCGYCGGAYLCPDLSADATNMFYSVHYRKLFPYLACKKPNERLLFQTRSRDFALRRAKLAAAMLPRGGRVLEVGSGHGAFLGRLHALRSDVDLFAVEFDNGERELALDGAQVRFIKMDMLKEHGQFDLVAMFHVFEHLIDPIGVLRALAALTKPEGQLLIEVPDAFKPGANWCAVHPAHTSYFSSRSLHRAVKIGHWQPTEQCLTNGEDLLIQAKPAATAQLINYANAAEIAELDARINATREREAPLWRRKIKRLADHLHWTNLLGDLSRRMHAPTIDAALSEPPSRWMCLGSPLDSVTQEEVIRRATVAMAQRKPLRLADVNTSKLIHLQQDPAFRSALLSADLCVADGMGVVWVARSLGIHVPERVTGIDTMAKLLRVCAQQGYRPFLLGARAEVVERAAANFCTQNPGLKLAGWHHGYFSDSEEVDVIALIQAAQPDCLIVALSSPQQDIFLEKIHMKSGVPFVMGVGGSFDVCAGFSRRAPVWMQQSGLEWFFRLIQEPRRLGLRYASSNFRLLLVWLPVWAFTLLRRRSSKQIARAI